MAKKIGQGGDPALSIEFFISGFYTYRSQLFAPFKGIGVNVVSFRDPVLDGANFELTDLFQWTRRPGFSIFCSEPLPDNEVVNQFYSARDLHGDVVDFVDTNFRLSSFDSTTITTLLPKSPTAGQGYVEQVGQRTYFADGAADDLSIYDGSTVAPWGLAAPNTAPTVTGMGFWQKETSFSLGASLLDPNGNVEVVTAILNPNGTIYSPASAENVALAGSLTNDWTPDSTDGGYRLIEGYEVIQQAQGYSGVSSGTAVATFDTGVTLGNVVLVEISNIAATGRGGPAPTITSVTDNLGNTYSVQAHGNGRFTAGGGGGGTDYISSAWVYSAPITAAGACTITVVLSGSTGVDVIATEAAGISATASTYNYDYNINQPSGMFNTGTVSFTGTQFVLSTFFISSSLASESTPPSGYTPGLVNNSAWYLADAYFGETATASPTWHMANVSNLILGLTTVFPLSSLATGYTKYLFLYDWGAAIPSGATIVGVVLNLPKQNLAGGAVQDYSVKMVIAGTPTGTDHLAAGDWSTTGFMTTQYGTAIDTWGASPTAAEINASGTSGFGFVISANITDTTGGSVVPEVGFTAPNNPTLTVFYKQANGLGGPGVSGINEPIWAVTISNTVNDGGLAWTNYGPIQSWYPATAFTPPTVVLDANSFLELSTSVMTAQNPNYMGDWDSGATYAVGDIVYFGGQYWLSLQDSNTDIPPSTLYTTSTTTGGTTTVQPWWAITESPFTTGLIAPVWSLVPGQTTGDGSFLWTNIGQGSQLASVGYGYVYAYRTIFGHLSTASPVSANTGAILGPLNATISEFAIDAGGIVTFTGANNFLPGNIFQVQGLTSSVGTALNNFSYTVISAVNSETFPLTEVAVSSGNVATITAINNLVTGQKVTFSGVQTATFLNGQTVIVLSGGLSGTQFEANIASGHASYGPTADAGNVEVIGSYKANAPADSQPWPVSAILDSGVSVPLIASLTGFSTSSALCNSVATITNVSLTANIVTVTAANNFQPGLYVTLTGLMGALFLNNQQVQVTAVDNIIGTENTYFQFYFDYPNYASTTDTGIATFNAVEIYRTSDGGGTYLFDGAVTNPIAPAKIWMYNDFVVNADLDIEQIAPLAHLNDPPPGAPGSTITTSVGTILRYWQGRMWMAVGNYVYFSAGPDCTNGIPEEAWPPSYRFQFVGPVFALEETPDGNGLLVYLADRVNQILGGPDTISFYATDALSNFGISNPNAIFRDGSIIGQLVTQKQYIELIGPQKQDTGEHIADYLTTNFPSAKTYVTMHRDGLDVGVFLSNGTDTILRYGSNITAWSVPAFPIFGAGALNSIETSVGIYSLMVASPTGGKTGAQGPVNPGSGLSITSSGPAWVNPGNITAGNPTSYATTTFVSSTTSQVLRASAYPLTIPATAVVQGVTLTLVGKQSTSSDLTVTVTPTNAPAGALSSTFSFGTSNTTQVVGGPMILWGMPWSQPGTVNNGALSFDITATNTGGGVAFTELGSDNFTRTNENPLSQGGNWVTVSGYDDLQIVSDKCEVVTTSADCTALYSGVTLPNNQYCELTVGALAVGDGIALWLRAAPTSPFLGGYFILIRSTGITLESTTTGTLGTFAGAISATDTILAYALGTTIVVEHNGTAVITTTDSSFASGSAALEMTATTAADTYVTSFEVGSVTLPEVYVAEVQVTVTYQNPGNYLYARDVNSWGDDGAYGQNNGTPYDSAFVTIGNITLTPPGAQEIPLQHIVGYFDAVGTLNNGGPSQPNMWLLPNELAESTQVPFIQLPEVLPEPPMGQNHPSQTILALRWPVNAMNMSLASQFVHHLQCRVEFEPELAANTIKALAFKSEQI